MIVVGQQRGPVPLDQAHGADADSIAKFLLDIVGRRRDSQGRTGPSCRFIRPAMTAGSLFFDSCPSSETSTVKAHIRGLSAWCDEVRNAHEALAIVLACTAVDRDVLIQALYGIRHEVIGLLADRGQTGALVFRASTATSLPGRVAEIPATPFWVIRPLVRADIDLAQLDARTAAAWSRIYESP